MLVASKFVLKRHLSPFTRPYPVHNGGGGAGFPNEDRETDGCSPSRGGQIERAEETNNLSMTSCRHCSVDVLASLDMTSLLKIG